MKLTARLFAIAFLSLLPLREARAHAFLDHAIPAVGSRAEKPPSKVRLWFTEKIETAFSKVQVFDSQSNEIDLKDVHADSEDPRILEVSLPALGPGNYKVAWRVVSVDTHVTQGDFSFRVVPAPDPGNAKSSAAGSGKDTDKPEQR